MKIINNKLNFNLLFIIILISSIIQLPEAIIIFKNFGLQDNYVVYFFRLLSISSSLFLIIFFRPKYFNLIKYKYIFIFYYSISDFFTFNSIDLILIVSFLWKLLTLIAFSIIVERNSRKENFWIILGWFLFISGIIIMSGEDFLFKNILVNINILFIMGFFLIFRRNYISLFIFSSITIVFLFLAENRTLIIIMIVYLLIIISSININYYLQYKFINIFCILSLIITIPIIIIIEGNTWFTYSTFSGRASIWLYWINLIHEDNFRYLFGISLNSPDFYIAVYNGNSSLGYDFTHQFHSGFIALFVRGGILLLTLFFLYIVNELKRNIFNIYSVLTFIGITLFISVNSNFDFLYPNIYGLLFLSGLGYVNINKYYLK